MTILVVEDESALALALAAALRLCGYEVAIAENGVEGLAHVDASPPPDLVVLDLQMPEMDGWQFLREFRSRAECVDVPVVVTSAWHKPETERLDAQAFFDKPFDLDEFLDEITRLLTAREVEATGRRALVANEQVGGEC
jgi:CheY-like chemotaxis protein